MDVAELDRLCQVFIEKKAYQKKAEDRMKEIKQETKDAQSAVIGALEALDKTENEGSFGKVKITPKEYFKCVDKDVAYNWLRERGEFDSLASINANTLSGHVKGIVHEKRDAGDFAYEAPGMVDSTSDYTYLKVTEP